MAQTYSIDSPLISRTPDISYMSGVFDFILINFIRFLLRI